jgi:Uri superfamily endonuclease
VPSKTGSTNKGTYALIMRCRKLGRTKIGRLGDMRLRPGFYIYVGSAQGPGGIEARVARHRRRKKKLHWHIDYLRRHTALIETWTMGGTANREHDWAEALAVQLESAHDRFGASDCRCRTHLFYSADMPTPDMINKQSNSNGVKLQVNTFANQ